MRLGSRFADELPSLTRLRACMVLYATYHLDIARIDS